MTVIGRARRRGPMRIVDQITPDIVLLDAVMPGMDGFETCRASSARPLEQRAGPSS